MRATPRTWPSIRLRRLSSPGLFSRSILASSRRGPYTPRGYLQYAPRGIGPQSGRPVMTQHHHHHHGGPSADAPADPRAVYTCPMHPQIRQLGPGSCPICGMALEPLTPTGEDDPNAELADMSRRFWIALVLT